MEMESVRALGDAISQITQLSSLSLTLGGYGFGNDNVGAICTSIQKLSNLVSLRLMFNYCVQVGAEGENFIAECLRHMHNLTFLALAIRYSKIGLVLLSEAIRDMSKLICLKLVLHRCRIGVGGGHALSKCLSQMSNLTSLDIDLEGNPLGDDGVRMISESIQKVNNLASLVLSLNNTRIGVEGARSISKCLSVMSHLTSLTLHLDTNSGIGVSGVKLVRDAIHKMKNLSSLQLTVWRNKLPKETLVELRALARTVNNRPGAPIDPDQDQPWDEDRTSDSDEEEESSSEESSSELPDDPVDPAKVTQKKSSPQSSSSSSSSSSKPPVISMEVKTDVPVDPAKVIQDKARKDKEEESSSSPVDLSGEVKKPHLSQEIYLQLGLASHVISVQQLFTELGTLVIPLYQRPYAWEEGNAEALVDDIFKAQKNKDKSFYTLGSISLTIHPGDESQVVDGQQRTTTTYLLLLLLGEFARTWGFKHQGLSSILDVKSPVLKLQGSRAVMENSRLQLVTQHLREIFENFHSTPTSRVDWCHRDWVLSDKTKATQKMIANFVCMKEYLNISDLKDTFKAFVDFLLDRTLITCQRFSEVSQAISIFVAMNTRGVRLTDCAALKAFLVADLDVDFVGMWDKKFESIGIAQQNQFFGWLHANMLLSDSKPLSEPDKQTTARTRETEQSYKTIQQDLKKTKYLEYFMGAFTKKKMRLRFLLTHVFPMVKTYETALMNPGGSWIVRLAVDLSEAKFNKGNQAKAKIAQRAVCTLKLFRRHPLFDIFGGLLLFLLTYAEPKVASSLDELLGVSSEWKGGVDLPSIWDFIDNIERLMSLSYLLHKSDCPEKGHSDSPHRLAYELLHIARWKPKKFEQTLNAELERILTSPKRMEAITLVLNGPLYQSDHKFCLYALWRYESLLGGGVDIVPHPSIEHICPQAAIHGNSTWVKTGKWTKVDHLELSHLLGNLMILGRDDNSKLSDRKWSEKHKILFDRSLGHGICLSACAKELEPFECDENLTPDFVRKRQQRILAELAAQWRIDLKPKKP
eukprot:CAMPEP_0174246376 /NCGR_PEP_ID=MMETSP0417-20130205/42041_1 /TAXON_ID=242541 /ORGANISM="Mayorella sp, Strain BSH-02190019" /LENGTH=1033 /DNA_ID=CAMNT_0015326229 /DNA_START=711 /DNA_END=3812 /DNA_ORIENTATION=+